MLPEKKLGDVAQQICNAKDMENNQLKSYIANQIKKLYCYYAQQIQMSIPERYIDIDKLLTIRSASQLYGVAISTIKTKINEGILKTVLIDSIRFCFEDEIIELKKHLHKEAVPAGYISIKETSEKFGVPIQTLRSWRYNGIIQSAGVKIEKKKTIYIDPESVTEYLSKSEYRRKGSLRE